jgi:hypothetical protein
MLGVMLTVPVTGAVELLRAVKPGTLFVVPLFGDKPILELLTLQEYVAPTIFEVNELVGIVCR